MLIKVIQSSSSQKTSRGPRHASTYTTWLGHHLGSWCGALREGRCQLTSASLTPTLHWSGPQAQARLCVSSLRVRDQRAHVRHKPRPCSRSLPPQHHSSKEDRYFTARDCCLSHFVSSVVTSQSQVRAGAGGPCCPAAHFEGL